MRRSLFALLSAWSSVKGVTGFENKFLFPVEDGLTFYYMNTIQVKYQSNFSEPMLYIFCKEGNGDAEQKDKTISAPKNNGTIAVTLDFSKADRCWFNLRSDDTRNNLGVNSPHQWKFQADEKNTTTVKAPDATTTKQSSSTTISTSSLTSPTTAATTTATTATTAVNEAATTTAPNTAIGTAVSDNSAATGAKIGIGIGIAFAGLFVMTAIGMVASKILRKRRLGTEQLTPSNMSFVGAQSRAGAVSYNPVSQFEPGGATQSNLYRS